MPALLYCHIAFPQLKTKQPEFQAAFNQVSPIIENAGQYPKSLAGAEQAGTVQYGFEGFDMPVYFTTQGLIFLQKKTEGPSEEQRERMHKKQVPAEVIAAKTRVIYQKVIAEWVGCNAGAAVEVGEQAEGYHTYAGAQIQAKAFKKITYKNIYPGIDIVYAVSDDAAAGFEYSIIARPGADIGLVKLKYSGDVKKIKVKSNGTLVIKSGINEIKQTGPLAFYKAVASKQTQKIIKPVFLVHDNIVSFAFPGGYDKTATLIIDPFVTNSNNLTGTNASKAKDIDFDYAGNVYVTGGGDGSTYKLSKFNPAGVLLWTFNGSIITPAWNFGGYYGGWVVDKLTGNVYMGQGFAPGTGFIVIRYNTNGLYDNYISTGNLSFQENWKMIWNCNGGSPRILIAGGGTNSNINLGILTPPSTTISSANLTNITGWAQDAADLVIDPATNSIFTIFGSLFGTPSLTGKIYKNNPPYSGATIAWAVDCGYSNIQEASNRPYMAAAAGGLQDNSANAFAINSSYLFYWDGKNLKAFDKTTGATAGTPLTLSANTALMQGGIIADECNNIYIGSANGTIKVYKFNGSIFDDAANPDITVAGFATNAVYDLAYNEAQKILYASGDGFVSSYDVTAYNCSGTVFTLTPTAVCATASVTTAITPIPPAGSIVTYSLYNGPSLVTTNTTGTFTGLLPATAYTIKATVNQQCSGSQATVTFTLPGANLSVVSTNTTCGNNAGTITATASGGETPYSYSIDGTNYQATGNFTGLAAGLYTVYVKDASVCTNASVVNILNSDGPALSVAKTDALCGSNTGNITITGSAGTPPYEYSINGTVFQLNNFFTGMLPGTYTVTIKDAADCINTTAVTIANAPAPTVTATPSSAKCNQLNGSITVFASSGTTPYQYSINGNTYQAGNSFTGLAPGAYTVYVKDANNCLATVAVTIANVTSPIVTAVATTATCANFNGSITAAASGGTIPYQYSVEGINFQTANFFTGLAAGSYTVFVKDVNDCMATFNITIASTNGPSLTTSSTASACGANTGTVTAVGTGGTGALTYSINGTTFQASGSFASLAPGTYTVFVRDANLCMGVAIAVVASTAAPTITAAATPTACISNTGEITATGSGGTGGLTYSIDGISYGASNVFSNLASGNYTLYVKDANDCIASTSVFVDNASGLSLAASSINSSCSVNNGSITATANGGAGALTYSIDGSTYFASGIFTGLGAGAYTVYVKDANNCIVTRQTAISSFAAPQVTASFIGATCSGNNGTITANGSGGQPPLKYSINGTVYQTSNIFLNVTAGTYTVYVKDTSNCIGTTTVTVTNTGSGTNISTFTVVSKAAYFCNEGDLGKITNPRVNGANCGTCTFSLNGGPFVANQTQLFLDLAPGTYTVTAMNASGCTKTIIATITEGVPSTASYTVTGSACNGTTGTISLTGIGPNTPYHSTIDYGGTWIDFDPSFTYTGLAPGIYDIILADDASFDEGPPAIPGGCLDTVTVIVPSIGGPSLDVTNTKGICGGATGIITASGSGGTGLLEYSIDGFTYQTSGIFTGLPSGIYYVHVRDASNCIKIVADTLTNSGPPVVSAVATATSCNGANGKITVTASGGLGPLVYSINGTVFQPGNVFTGVTAGTYTVTVADSTACITTSLVTVTVGPKPIVTAFPIAATCNGNNGGIFAVGSSGVSPYQYSVDGGPYQSNSTFTGLSAGLYTVNIKDNAGCIMSTNIAVTNAGAPVISTVPVVTAKCLNASGSITINASGGSGALQYSIDETNFQAGNVFTNLLPGTYTVSVKDASGCIAARNVAVANVNGPSVLTAAIIDASCGLVNGRITASASGGTAPLQYSINGTTYQASNVFNPVADGIYTLHVKDFNNCIKTLPVTINMLASPTITAVPAPASCGTADGYITAAGAGGTGALTYSKNGVAFQASNIFTALPGGAYTITVKDAKGCTAIANITVSQIGGPSVSTTNSGAGCGGGDVTMHATGGTGVYQYSINDTTYVATNTFSGLAAGTYTAYVKDAAFCIGTASFTITPPVGTPGTWTGAVSTDWFNCNNWQTATVPTNVTDVFIPATANNPVIDPASPFASAYGGIARAKNIVVDTDSLVFKVNGLLNVAGNVILQNSAQIDMALGGEIQIAGNWINNVGTTGFVYGIGKIMMQGSIAQTVFTIAANETFNQLWINHTGAGVDLLSNITVADSLRIIQGLVTTGTNTLDGGNLTMLDGTLRLSKNNIVLPELATYNLTGGTIEFNGTDTQTIRPINYYHLLSTSSGFRKFSSMGVTGIAAVFTTGTNFYAVDSSAINFNGTIAQDIPPVKTHSPAPYVNQYNILIVSNGDTKSATGDFTITDSLKVNATTEFAIGSNVITIKSDSNKTARVGMVEGTISNAGPGGYYNVERFIPAHTPPKRAWRLLTAPVTGPQTINETWQESALPSTSGATPPATAFNPDPQPGYGLHISGPGAPANGFDQTPLNNSSMKYYDSVNNTWLSIPNTAAALSGHEGYMTFVRGNRSYIISTTTANTTPLNTILRSRGDLKTHVQSYSGSGFRVIGNPYASSINLHDAIRTGDAVDGYYIWDPLIATPPLSSSGVGAFLPVLYIPGTGYVTAVDPNTPGPSYHPFDINGVIQSGAAFMVDFGTGGTLEIHESNKVSGSNNYQFRPSTDPHPQLRTILYAANTDSSVSFLADGALQLFDPGFSNNINRLDLKKADNFLENISLNVNNSALSIETRMPIRRYDTVQYNIKQMHLRNYKLVIAASNFFSNGIHGYAEDSFTGARIPLNLTGETAVNFTVTSDPASSSQKRFRLVFENTNAVVLPLSFTTISGYKEGDHAIVQWKVENETGIKEYVLEQSADGVHFHDINSVQATAGNLPAATYRLPHTKPSEGNNFYRIRSVSFNGEILYSAVVKILFSHHTRISLLSNPVKGNKLTLKFSNVKKGEYSLRLLDNNGRSMMLKTIKHPGGNTVETFYCNRLLAGSVYQLKVSGPETRLAFEVLHQ